MFEVHVPLWAVVLIGVFLAGSFVMGRLMASSVAQEEGGPVSIILWSDLMALLCAAGSGFISYAVLKDAHLAWAMADGAAIGITAAVLALVWPAIILFRTRKDAAYHQEMASKVQAFAIKHFDALDADGCGLIADEDLLRAAEKLYFDESDRHLLAYMRRHLSDLGHVISSSTTKSMLLTPMINGLIPLAQSTTDYVYGIDRKDLKTYPRRVAQRYRHW